MIGHTRDAVGFQQIKITFAVRHQINPAPAAHLQCIEGSSIGMSKVVDGENLKAAISLALEYDEDVIAEQWVNGAEYTASILDGQALPVIRLKTPRAFYDFEAKYQANTTEYLCPCGLEPEQEKICQTLAMAAFNALQMRGWGRIDLMADSKGNFYLLEANSVPGMTDRSPATSTSIKLPVT